MKRRRFVASCSGALSMLCAPAGAAVTLKSTLRDKLTTRAESSDYAQTSSYADVKSFLTALDARGAPISRGVLGKSASGRDIPYIVACRPMVSTPEQAFALGRPVVMLVGGLHGADVDGKEALLAIVRDLCLSTERTLLEDLVLVVVPLLNVDGNEKLGPQAQNAPEQDGPARVGAAADGAGFDIDADFIKLEAPETRGLLKLVREWKPDVYLDARPSGASFDAFALTLSPSLHPAAYYGGGVVRGKIIPQIRKDLQDKFSIDAFTSGHFGRDTALLAPPPIADVRNYGWFADDYHARSAVNYMGLRGIGALRVRAFAHDVLERRIYATRAAIESVLGYCSEHDDDVIGSTDIASHWVGGPVPLRGRFPATADVQMTIGWENLALSSEPPEPGVPAGLKRTGNFSSAVMPVFDHYTGTTIADQPHAYLIPYEYGPAIEPLLVRHGIIHDTIIDVRKVVVRDFVVERIDRSAEAIGGHQTISLSGHWQPPVDFAARFGAIVVPGGQPLGPLASVLLEPESDDGFVAWNVLDSVLRVGYSVPIFRVVG